MSRVEWTFTEMKAQAMGKLIDGGRNWQHLVSIGDCHFEMLALQSPASQKIATAAEAAKVGASYCPTEYE